MPFWRQLEQAMKAGRPTNNTGPATWLLDTCTAKYKLPGQSGVKHLTQWMKTRFDAGNGAAASGLGNYLQTFTSYADTNAFITDFKGTNGRNFVNTQIVPNLSNGDTGSIAGSDAGGGGALDGKSVVPDNTGTAGGSPVYETEKASLAATIDCSGETWNLQTVNTITVSDTATYNLENITNARGTLTPAHELDRKLGIRTSFGRRQPQSP